MGGREKSNIIPILQIGNWGTEIKQFPQDHL